MANTSPEINPNLYVKPVFQEKDGQVFEAASVSLLVGKVIAYRKRQGKPIGTVSAEIIDQLCNRQPHLCNWPAKAPIPKTKPQHRGELNKRILDWVTGIAEKYLVGKLRFVREKKEVERRFRICSACPRAQTWASSCAACRAEVARLEREVKAPLGPMGIRFDESEKLNGCGVLGEDPRVSIFLDEQKVASGNLPTGCWRKK
jgi:hypothetical protein